MKHTYPLLLLITLITSTLSPTTPTIKKGTEVFEKWVKIQAVLQDRSPTEMIPLLNDEFLRHFRSFYENNFMLLKPLTDTLSMLTGGQINSYGYQFTKTMQPDMVLQLTKMYELLEHSPQGCIDFLKQSSFSPPEANQPEELFHFDTTVDKYKAFMRLLFKQQNSFKESEMLAGVANRFFEYCFNPHTFSHYKTLLDNYAHYPLVRFLHSIMWYNLVGEGWKNWHKNALTTLQEKSEQGDRIIYPAGGTDLYMLLQHGIYNITIIDPFLPSQERYYAHDWEWLIKGTNPDGGLNDEIHFHPPYRHLTLKRTSFSEGDTFYAKLSTGNVAILKKSSTTWTVIDGSTNEPCGTVIIERRNTIQRDFIKHEHETIVMSYDELVYAISPEFLNGWGINPDNLDEQQTIVIKQLRHPVTKPMTQNLRTAIGINFANVKFINFASDPT